MRRTSTIQRLNLAALACLILFAGNVSAQQATAESVHWAYSSYFGSGWYQVGGDRDVFVLRMTPRWEIREASFAADGTRSIGVEFSFPITAGLDKFSLDDIPGVVDPENLASVSVIPGINITVPVNDRWSLRPFAAVGWGQLLNGSESAWTYWTGVKSEFRFGGGDFDWALINAMTYVGFTPDEGPSEDFWPLMIGLTLDYPFGQRKTDGEQMYLSWHSTYTSFENSLDLTVEVEGIKPITDQWEIGLSFRRQDSRIKIWFLNFDRLGLAYRFSSSGDLKGIAFVFRSVFESL
jgi:hypothetical protein